MNSIFRKGVYPTMITPYQKNGEVDLDTVKKYVHWYYQNGCDGIFAICQSSEIFSLSLDERIAINRTAWQTVREIEEKTGDRMTVVSSGHISDTLEEQARELCAVAESGTDALILITNRLAAKEESDDVWIKNAEMLLQRLPAEIALGLYECPYPYKRLLTPKILDWCIQTKRFKFIKDTCCDPIELSRRLEQLRKTELWLFDANCQSLTHTLQNGGAGFCGIMANYHPQLYAWLCKNYAQKPQDAALVQAFLSMAGFTEDGLPYPTTAKYHMTLEGIPTELTTRKLGVAPMNELAKSCMEQMRTLSKYIESTL